MSFVKTMRTEDNVTCTFDAIRRCALIAGNLRTTAPVAKFSDALRRFVTQISFGAFQLPAITFISSYNILKL